jgi:hypothetical protein
MRQGVCARPTKDSGEKVPSATHERYGSKGE